MYIRLIFNSCQSNWVRFYPRKVLFRKKEQMTQKPLLAGRNPKETQNICLNAKWLPNQSVTRCNKMFNCGYRSIERPMPMLLLLSDFSDSRYFQVIRPKMCWSRKQRQQPSSRTQTQSNDTSVTVQLKLEVPVAWIFHFRKQTLFCFTTEQCLKNRLTE